MTRRFWIGLVLTIPTVILEMGGHIPALGLHHLVPAWLSTWIQLVLATPVVLWAGAPFFERGWASITGRSLNMFTLIALGTGTAYLYSLVATVLPGLFPVGFRGMDGTVPLQTNQEFSHREAEAKTLNSFSYTVSNCINGGPQAPAIE